ncbi:MAG: PAS domain S-box protein [Candidatus Sulfopaludibacter sp.]|nr:PAS domain S-box protein [Candidatus Sulfopaludibacter sp.]
MPPPSEWKSLPARYGGALACAAASLLVRFAFNPLLEKRIPYAFTVVAVLLCTRYLGIGPGILTAVGGGAVAGHFFAGASEPFPGSLGSVSAGGYVLICAAVIWVVELQRRQHGRTEAAARLASQRLEELRRETAVSTRLRAIVESSEDAIVSTDLEGVIRSWNDAAGRIFGYTRAEMVGTGMARLLPPDRIREEAGIEGRIRDGSGVKHFETVRLRKGGQPIPVSLTISPVYDEAGRVVGASQIGRDIREQKQMEEQLRQTQKLESLGVLAGGLAHDFNNLLTGIMGNASLALHDPMDPGTVRAHIDEVIAASERAAMLVRQMLAYAGKGRIVVEPVDLSQQISEIVTLIRTSIPRSVDLHLELDAEGPHVVADRSQVQQLIMNLSINAAEAIGEQPGTVTIQTSRRETNQETQAVLTIKDTGCGMDEATKAQMFDPFFTTKFTGRGLGLAAVLGIIRTHRGSISVESAPGTGTVVTVVLPASMALVPGTVPEDLFDVRGFGNILVVDDEAMVRNLAKFALERCGYTIELAQNGKEALDVFAARPDAFAAVILDLTMPVMAGEEALDRLRQLRVDIPVLLSSGFSEEDALQRFHGKGLSGFLQKPYTATALARKIKQALRPAGMRSGV